VSTTYKIKDVADRSGFSAATLRYYEEIGLLPEATRTPAGYRMYDDHTLDRLAFISRAKHLGCSLDEITDLTTAWDGGRCGPVQDRLRDVVANKLASAQQQIVELMTLTADLQLAAAALESHRPDGPCDDTCGCVTTSVSGTLASGPQLVRLGKKPLTATAAVPIACTLGSQSMRGRLDEWQRLLEHVEHREPIDDGLRATFAPSAPLGELIRLAAAEQDCCQFFTFTITIDNRGVALEVRAPHDALPILHSLFGQPA
jgi:DNA-binding transcriptional MerR regulator